jgi:hypothetical protein
MQNYVNNKMRFLLPSFFISLVIFQLLSCNKDPEEVSGCLNEQSDNYNPLAITDSGDCIPWNSKYEGDYSFKQLCQSGSSTVFDVFLVGGFKNDEILLKRKSDNSLFITLKCTSKFEFIIPKQQTVTSTNVIEVEGEGKYNESSKEITFNYSLLSILFGTTADCDVKLVRK